MNLPTTIANNMNVADFMAEVGTSWDYGLSLACSFNRLDLVNLMISEGAEDWDRGMRCACRDGHLDLANLMIAKGAYSWNWGMVAACGGGHLDLVNLMITNGANNWNWGMNGACEGGHLDLANLMISKGADNWNSGLRFACVNEYTESPNTIKCAKRMISKGADDYGCLHTSSDVFLYKVFCQNHAVHDVERLHKLIREQDPLYTLVIHYDAGSVPLELPMDLLRYCKSFLS